MRAIDIAAEAFSFLSPATPATFATTRANACSAPLRQVCDTCDTAGGDGSPGVACRKCRNGVATPETRANARLSRVSQLSQGVAPESRSQARIEAAAQARLMASPANRLTAEPSVSQLAALAISQKRDAVLERLLRWGWPSELAEATADRVARRAADDDRRTCYECQHYAPGRCRHHKSAGLRHPDVGRDLASLPQRCPGFGELGAPLRR